MSLAHSFISATGGSVRYLDNRPDRTQIVNDLQDVPEGTAVCLQLPLPEVHAHYQGPDKSQPDILAKQYQEFATALSEELPDWDFVPSDRHGFGLPYNQIFGVRKSDNPAYLATEDS